MVAISCPSCGHAWNSTASKTSQFNCKSCGTSFRLESRITKAGKKTSGNGKSFFGLTNWGGFKHEDGGFLSSWGGIK